MKTLFVITAILLPLQDIVAQNKYATNSGYVSFFSKGSVTDVDAQNKKLKVQMTSEGEVTVDITMTDFQFKNQKMGRDARKKYLEIDKYPKAGFKGKIQDEIDYDKVGTYNATAIGKLKIHGVEREVMQKGTVTVGEKGQVKLYCEFSIALKDYAIEVPDILGVDMTDDRVLVKVEATLIKAPK